MLKQWILGTVLAAAAWAQNAAPAGVDTIIQLVQGGLSEELVIQTIQTQGHAYQLAPTDLLKLTQAGVSQNIISTMMNPEGATATAATDAGAAAPEPLPVIEKKVRKRRLAVLPFDYAAVERWVHYWFGGPYNVGEGIRAMLTARMHQAKHFVLVERTAMDAIQKELALSNTSLVNQGTKVKTGRMSAADVILMGDITIFGRDDSTEQSKKSSSVFGAVKRFPGFGSSRAARQATSIGQMTKEEKAVVAIALRLVDTETGEILETAEARGESSRVSKNWDEFVVTDGQRNSSSERMTSSNFEATIIGEATSNAVDRVIELLDERLPAIPLRGRDISGRVAQISGGNPILAFGANLGVEAGDRFEILKILNEVVDPATKEVLDVATAPAGTMVVTEVRERIAMGSYSGEALLPAYEKGYQARLIIE